MGIVDLHSILIPTHLLLTTYLIMHFANNLKELFVPLLIQAYVCCLKKVTMEMKLKGYFLMESKHLYKMVALKMSYIQKIIKRTQTKGKPTRKTNQKEKRTQQKGNPLGR